MTFHLLAFPLEALLLVARAAVIFKNESDFTALLTGLHVVTLFTAVLEGLAFVAEALHDKVPRSTSLAHIIPTGQAAVLCRALDAFCHHIAFDVIFLAQSIPVLTLETDIFVLAISTRWISASKAAIVLFVEA